MKAGLKTILLSALSTFAAFSAVTYNSCTPDKCKSIVCAYGGVCKEGTCYCQAGYEGPQCETVINERYEGSWTVLETGSITRTVQYTLEISPGTTMTELVIDNLYDKLSGVKANFNRDTLFIPQQTIEGYTVQGKGLLTTSGRYGRNGTLTVRYTVREPNGNVNDFGTSTTGRTNEASVWNK